MHIELPSHELLGCCGVATKRYVCKMQIVVSIQVNEVRLTHGVNIDCNFDTTVKVSSNISMCFRTVGLDGTRI